MKKRVVFVSIIFGFFALGVTAATLTVKCPAYFGLKSTKQFFASKNKYVCFATSANAKKAGYKDANAKKNWKPVTNLSSSLGQITDPFTVTGSPWRVRWNHSGDGHFAIVVYDANTTDYKKLLVNTIGSTNALSNYYGAGRYYFDVSADGPWTAIIEEYR